MMRSITAFRSSWECQQFLVLDLRLLQLLTIRQLEPRSLDGLLLDRSQIAAGEAFWNYSFIFKIIKNKSVRLSDRFFPQAFF